MDFSAIIKEKLLSLISEIDQYHWLFTRNPEKDFSRIKKWSFGEIVRFIITMEGKSLSAGEDQISPPRLSRYSRTASTPPLLKRLTAVGSFGTA